MTVHNTAVRMTMDRRLARYVAALMVGLAMLAQPASADETALDRLVSAYPDFLAGHDATALIWKDGTRMALSDGRNKSFDEKLRGASLEDQMSLAYHPGHPAAPPAADDDPGRFRNVAFFTKMYGDCFHGGVTAKLVRVPWLPDSGGGSVTITSINGVDKALAAVSAELDRLPARIKREAFPSAGTFNCRVVKDTGQPSMHSWGAAIDISTRHADYWLWRKGGYRNRIPLEIVDVFERHGFIWGGKWSHYDTMHFEYRPEMF